MRYHLCNTIPPFTDPDDPLTCGSSPQARNRRSFNIGDPSILALGCGNKIKLLYSEPSCEMESFRGGTRRPRDPNHGIVEKLTIRLESDVLSIECFPDSWLLAYGLRNGDIGIHDYRLPPEARMGLLHHPSSVTGVRKLQGNEIIACGPQHAVCILFSSLHFC